MHCRRVVARVVLWAAVGSLLAPGPPAWGQDGPDQAHPGQLAEERAAENGAAEEGAAAGPTAAPTRAELERFTGLYRGAIVYRPAEAELETVVEIGLDGEGRLAGTIDQPGFFQYQPLQDFAVDGDRIDFVYRRFSEVRGPDALFAFEGRLVDGGAALEGEFLESRGRIPFRFERVGDVGTPRPEPSPRPLTDLSPEGIELRTAFNAAPDHVRLVLLLSPS